MAYTQMMRPSLPLSLRLLNWGGSRLERAGAFRNLLSVESIMEQAKMRTGLSDWGDEGFLTPLELLIYEHFGYPFSEEFKSQIISWLKENPKGKHGVHRYSLEQFGLTQEHVWNLFSNYCDEFDVSSR